MPPFVPVNRTNQNQNAAQIEKPNSEAAPRVSMADAPEFHSGQDITVVCKPIAGVEGTDHAFVFECFVTKRRFHVHNIIDADGMTLCMEMTLRFINDGSEMPRYNMISMSGLNDDFDIERYKKLLQVIKLNKGLFYN
jgi:hypothetical protein